MLNHTEGHFTTWTVLLLSFFPICCYVEDTILSSDFFLLFKILFWVNVGPSTFLLYLKNAISGKVNTQLK